RDCPHGFRSGTIPHQFPMEPVPRRKDGRTQPLACHHSRMERPLTAAPRRFWPERPGGVSWGLRIQRAGRGRRFPATAPCAGARCQGPRVCRIGKITMPGTTAFPDVELVVDDVGGGGGGPTPPPSGGDDDKRRRPGTPSPNRYYTGITLGIVSILMLFMALAKIGRASCRERGQIPVVHAAGKV